MAKADDYEIDEGDGLRRALVGPWVRDKHIRLQWYVGASSGARSPKKGWPGSAYIDLYCGPGRAKIRGSDEIVDGSALVAVKEAAKRQSFTEIHIADKDPENVEACRTRLQQAGFSAIHTYVGEAVETARMVAGTIGPGLHLAFLDPYNLIEFEVLRNLGKIPKVDLLIHVSELDLQREAIGKRSLKKLNAFVPGWAKAVDIRQRPDIVKAQIFQYWKSLVRQELGMHMRDKVERVRGGHNQPLYWLVLASRAAIAEKLWSKISDPAQQADLF